MNECTPSRIVASSTAMGTSSSTPIAAVSRSLPSGFGRIRTLNHILAAEAIP